MGIFSRLFDKSNRQSKSYVKDWAERRRNDLRHSDDVTPEYLFAVIIFCLATFSRGKTHKLATFSSQHYSSDATLFELGCYLYFRVDMWLFLKKPHLREGLSITFQRQFVHLFTKALGIDNVHELFDERVSKYGKIARTCKGNDINECHLYLSQLILRTKNGTLPETYDFDSEPLDLDFWADMGLKTELSSWEQ
jgi:hypothetical protein